jgi:hypothetical protein
VLALAVLSCTSCGGGKKYYSVRGSVLVNGKPAEGVTIVFCPQNDDPELERPSAGTRADGSFELTTFLTKDRVLKTGAPAGSYVVTCFWLPPNAGSIGAGQAVPDRLQGKYMDPKKSPLRAQIPENAVDLPPFQLEIGKK